MATQQQQQIFGSYSANFCHKRSSPCSPTQRFYPSTDAFHSSTRNRLNFASPNSSSENASPHEIREQLLSILGNLEFRRAFLLLSYIKKVKLEKAMAVDDANQIVGLNNLPMQTFEAEIWRTYGEHYCDESERIEYLDWDSRKTHLYHCHIDTDGSYTFKGPILDTTRTHLQRELGDDNVLIVKFAEEKDTLPNPFYPRIAQEGILVCLRRFRFFVFKDGGKAEKKKSSTSSAVKCYFVRMESTALRDQRENYILSNKKVHEARSMFMHLHMVPSMAKFAARSSLILSKTIKLQIDLDSVHVKRIDDILCYDEKGCVVLNEDGEPLIQTDGTGFISEDLAMMCPKQFNDAKYIRNDLLELLEDDSLEPRAKKACIREAPLLIQCRLYKDGLAVKGTLLLNKKLKERTIEIRPSMIKVEQDPQLQTMKSFNSLEMVAVSYKPRNATLSKNLIALLSYGGVRQEFFLGLLKTSLDEAKSVNSDFNAALNVATNLGDIDDDCMTLRMLLAGIDPVDEPYLKHRLSHLANVEKTGFKIGRIPISESFYLMGTVDPTGLLKRDEVCVILENGQISGKVLVYRNPGLHFGDIHVLNATYVPELHEYVGNAKYAIFFSTKGPRSVGSEIANGDFDGDMYWVSRNPQLLEEFKPSEPWKRIYTTPKAAGNIKPSNLLPEQLQNEYFKLFLNATKPSNCMGMAADSWLSQTDQLLVSVDADEKLRLKNRILKLIDIYYDSLDAPKSGKKAIVPEELKAVKFPHYMEREKNKYHSTSVLGLMYDMIHNSEAEPSSLEEIKRFSCFDNIISQDRMAWGQETYQEYRDEMNKAMRLADELKNYRADELIRKYKKELYGAPEFHESTRKKEDIYNDAIALHRAAYEYAYYQRDVTKCGFVWKVAGHALCYLYAHKRDSKPPIICSRSTIRKIRRRRR